MNTAYVAIASASWARLYFALEALRILVRQRIALTIIVSYVLVAELHHEVRVFFRAPHGRHAAPRRAVVLLARHAR